MKSSLKFIFVEGCSSLTNVNSIQLNCLFHEKVLKFTGGNCVAPGQLVVAGPSGQDGPRSFEKVCVL